MINEKAMPRGTSASRNPIKSGIEEQEQNGVTAPKNAAIILPEANLCLTNTFLILWGGKKVLIKEMPAITKRTRT